MHALRLALVFVAGCAFDSHPPRPYASWQVQSGRQPLGCASIEAWASRSGRDGVGVTFELRGTTDEPCRLAIQSTVLRAGELRVPGDRLPPSMTLTRASAARAYVAYPFPVTPDMQRASIMVDGAFIELTLR